MTELLPSHDKTLMDEELLLMDEQRKWFLEMGTTLGKDVAKTVEMPTKDLEHHMNLTDKGLGLAGFDGTDSNFGRSSTVDKMLSNSVGCFREIAGAGKSQLMQQASLSS